MAFPVNISSLTNPVTYTSAFPSQFLYPQLFWLIIPAVLLLLWLVRHSFVRDNPRYDDEHSIRRRSKLRWTVFWLRTIAVVLIIAVLATPLTRQTTIKPGDIHLTVLLDTSASMQAMDTSGVDGLVEKLRAQMPVTVREITPGEQTPLGDAILANIKPGENILLVSDGYSTKGQDLASVFAFAAQTNSTIAALTLEPKITDAAVTIDAPEKAVADTNTTFTVHISSTEGQSVNLRIRVDNETVYEKSTSAKDVPVTKQYQSGRHQLVAEITTEDANPRNNRYEALLRVVDKPKLLVITHKDVGLTQLLGQLYTVTTTDTIPTDEKALAPYYAVVLVDLPAAQISPATKALTDYLLAGNGIFVVGGPNSFDAGNYKNAPFETLLPVSVGAGSPGKSITNIVLSLDMSSALEGSYVRNPDGTLSYQQTDRPALARSLAADVLADLDPNHNVGAVVIGASAANTSQNLLDKNYIFWDYIGGASVGHVSTLGPKRQALIDAISTIRGGGQAPSTLWLAAPVKAMENVAGAKNVIVITDGISCTANCLGSEGGNDEESTINIAKTIAIDGGHVYVVGLVDGVNEAFLANVALAGNGIYYHASEQNKLRILFGNPDDNKNSPDAFGLTVLNPNHFITKGVNLAATMYGYNQVVPKQYASLLVTAGTGQPALTVWNYGVGRVAAFTTYNGDSYGDITAKGNSLLISRTGNWLVGDPERLQTTTVDVPQLHVDEEGIISVKSESIPQNSALTFVPRGDGRYEATFTPAATGFGTVGSIPYAASYPREYENVGQDPNLGAELAVANGKLYAVTDADAIAENVRTVRQLEETRFQPLRAPLLLLVAVLFLIEIAVRRLYEVLRTRQM